MNKPPFSKKSPRARCARQSFALQKPLALAARKEAAARKISYAAFLRGAIAAQLPADAFGK